MDYVPVLKARAVLNSLAKRCGYKRSYIARPVEVRPIAANIERIARPCIILGDASHCLDCTSKVFL
jgi:hypothetical protein